jgi:hypothetical protein
MYSLETAAAKKEGWLKGDLHASRSLLVYANPNPSGGVTHLEIRKEGAVEGLGPWRLSLTSDVVSGHSSSGLSR